MRRVLEALRLRLDERLSHRAIARSLGVSPGSVHACLQRFMASGLPWPLPPDVGEATLATQLFRRAAPPPAAARPVPEWATVRQELTRKGVTLQLLWGEYKTTHPDGYQYTQFCRLYHAWAGTIDPVLRQVHIAGERGFIDYAGPTMPVLDLETGEERDAQIFVSALGASHLLYVVATWTQTLPDWISAQVQMLEYYGGVPALIVPDSASALVRHACYYEPVLNPTYQDFAAHYNTVILPNSQDTATQRPVRVSLACPNGSDWAACWASLRAPSASQDEAIWNEISNISTTTEECRALKNAAMDVYFDYGIEFYTSSLAPATLAGDIHTDSMKVHLSDIGNATNGYYGTTFTHESAHTIGYLDYGSNTAAQVTARCVG